VKHIISTLTSTIELEVNETDTGNFCLEVTRGDKKIVGYVVPEELRAARDALNIALGEDAAPSRARPHGDQEYLGNGEHEWEEVCVSNNDGTTWRLRVPGGWIYDTPRGSVFVPMPEVVGYAI
jgi:hypothetical protein